MYSGAILDTTPVIIAEMLENFKSEVTFNICNVSTADVNVVIELSRDGNTWYTIVNTTVAANDTILIGSYALASKTKIRASASAANAIHLTIYTLP